MRETFQVFKVKIEAIKTQTEAMMETENLKKQTSIKDESINKRM